MDLEDRQSAIDVAVQDVIRLHPDSHLGRSWSAVRETCYSATAAYLEAAADPDAAARNSSERGTLGMIGQAQQMLDGAVSALTGFEEHHRDQLTASAHEAADVRRRIEAATVGVHQVERSIDSTDPAYLRYASVAAAVTDLAAARRVLAEESLNGRLAAAGDAADHLETALTRVREVLAEAPKRMQQAHHAIVTARTRLQALEHRVDTIRPKLSALLREFPAASSEDLVGNEPRAIDEIAVARQLLDSAATAEAQGRPEDALDVTAEARRHLASAEELIDITRDRLDLLRRLRDDPGEQERRVRFQLRDAQRLVVSLELVDQWATVLDAQTARIDRIVAQIASPRPDYLAYSRELDHVSQFLTTTVAKIRASVHDG